MSAGKVQSATFAIRGKDAFGRTATLDYCRTYDGHSGWIITVHAANQRDDTQRGSDRRDSGDRKAMEAVAMKAPPRAPARAQPNTGYLGGPNSSWDRRLTLRKKYIVGHLHHEASAGPSGGDAANGGTMGRLPWWNLD